ncbi:MAG: MFS transporter [Desulfobacteraceae bacterium]|nr:MAG: MFS transporter [Desulfobacteraceae bacterium]
MRAPSYLAWLSWGLGAAFYFTGFYQRVAPAVMTDQLMLDFGIGAAALGNLSAFYYYSYVAVQIPTGVLADVWGPRRILGTGAIVAALGSVLFSIAPDILIANAGRLMIGASVGVAWVAMLKLAAHWFPPNRFALASGLGLFVGLGGAVAAGVPLRFLVDHFGWRPVMGISGSFTFLIGVSIWIIVRDDPSEKGYAGYGTVSGLSSSGSLLSGLRTVLRFKNMWLLSIGPSGIVGPLLSFAGLWGVPFLSTHYGMSPSRSAAFTSAILVAWAIGGPVLGALSDRVCRRKTVYLWGALAACSGWAVVLFVPELPLPILAGIFVLIGFASGAMVLGFAFVKESVPPAYAGTGAGVCNMGVMMGPMILQPLMGWVLDNCWDGRLIDGIRIYDLAAYRSAFLVMIAWSILAVILIALTTETYCRQMVGAER